MMTAPFRADFRIRGFFNGKDIPAAKWLKKLAWDLDGYATQHGNIPPHRWTQAFDLLLTEEASTCAETHHTFQEILSKDDPTEANITTAKALLCERFPSKSVEISQTSFTTELGELK